MNGLSPPGAVPSLSSLLTWIHRLVPAQQIITGFALAVLVIY